MKCVEEFAERSVKRQIALLGIIHIDEKHLEQ